MDRFEIDLGQAWARGLKIVFENEQSSRLLNLDECFHVDQVHGKEIYEVTASDMKKTGPLAQADGLMVRGAWYKTCARPLVIKTADCVPLIMIDRMSEVACILHAGWRGLAKGIHRIPFERKDMDPKTTWVWVGPCLNGDSFEVQEDLWTQFGAYARDLEIFKPTTDPQKKHFHVWNYLEKEFHKFGVDVYYNIEENTYTDTTLASYRRAQKDGVPSTARNLSWLSF